MKPVPGIALLMLFPAVSRAQESAPTADEAAMLTGEIIALMAEAEADLSWNEPQLSAEKQRAAIEKLDELIRRAQLPPNVLPTTVRIPHAPPPGYSPARNDGANKFRSNADRWPGNSLPPREREALYHTEESIEDFPPEFRELLRRYRQTIVGEAR